MKSRIAAREGFSEAMDLCWRVAALVKYGHFQDANQEVRAAAFINRELKEVICRQLELSKEFRASLLLDPFVKRCLAEAKLSD